MTLELIKIRPSKIKLRESTKYTEKERRQARWFPKLTVTPYMVVNFPDKNAVSEGAINTKAVPRIEASKANET